VVFLSIRVEGYVSKKVVRFWLENYQSLQMRDSPVDALPCNSGPKPYDGVTSTHLNKIMLDAAIKALPRELQLVVKARWIIKPPLKKTLQALGMSEQKYRTRCNQAIDHIYRHVNGKALAVKAVYDKICSENP